MMLMSSRQTIWANRLTGVDRIEKAAVLLFMRQGKFAALRLYRYVEP